MGALEIIPIVVHDGDGHEVRISDAAARELARLIVADAAYIYQSGTDRLFYNVWENRTRDDDTGYLGRRIPLADWARAYEASQGQDGGTAA